MDDAQGRGFVAIWNGITPAADADFRAWHAEEHMPERLAIPGFERGTRWKSETDQPRYFTLYTLVSPQVAQSRAYIDRLNDPTPWTRRIMSQFRDNARCVGSVVFEAGQAPGTTVVVVRLEGAQTAIEATGVGEKVMALAGVSGCWIGLSDAAASALPTAERMGRVVNEPWGMAIVSLSGSADADRAVASVAQALPKDAAAEIAFMTRELDRSAAAPAV